MANFESLTIFYPMWNEEDTIERAVMEAFEAGDALVAEGEIARYDVLIVNDASTDRTGELADALAAADPRVSVVHHPVNRKLGGSLKTGFASATGELVLSVNHRGRATHHLLAKRDDGVWTVNGAALGPHHSVDVAEIRDDVVGAGIDRDDVVGSKVLGH